MDWGTVIAFCSLAVAVFAALTNGRKDARSDAAREARTEAKLDSINAGVTDIRVEMRSMRDEIKDHGQRIVAVEARCKSAQHRLDELEKLFHKAHPPEMGARAMEE